MFLYFKDSLVNLDNITIIEKSYEDTGKGKVFYTLKFYSEDKLIDIFVFINKDEREKYFKGLLFSLSNKNKLIKLE